MSRTEHDSLAAMAEAVADLAAEALREAVDARGRASLAVPGGATPRAFLAALGRRTLDWARVTVTLTDERWVPLSSPRSNQRLVMETLFAGAAAAARFVPLYGGTPEPAASLPATAASLERDALPLDLAVFGMGADGHVASLLPDADRLAQALDPACPTPVLALRAPRVEEVRVTLTAPPIRAARRRLLLIAGEEKRAALARAEAERDPARAPVRLLLDAPGGVDIHLA